jgi:hypothetical protein
MQPQITNAIESKFFFIIYNCFGFSEKESGLSQARTPHNVKFLDCPKMDNGLPMGDSPF